ncbi:hypothetical protein [Sphingomonas crocodyli]|uniref:Uncharacterized protein n=1 Tax=Sphingomonas crocodyli TaxID=1979270 RepID=A0A437M6M6_9SPHN|nr:hypothetical protein [Sphingomonas crocodyli]RVT93297.1 hypothetical protein EOD43_05270 [Sphingomonas crocodyli]
MMTFIGINQASAALPIGQASGAVAKDLAAAAIGEIGHRLLAWVGASGGASTSGAASWSASVGASDFRPDASELARGGDVYDLNGLASSIAGQTGATPTEEGDLRRALEDFTRAAVVQVAGLAGADGDQQVAGLRTALDVAGSADVGEGASGVVARLELATRGLAAANGG